MACRSAGVKVEEGQLAEMAGSGEQRADLGNVARVARQLGFRAQVETWSLQELFDHGLALAGRTILDMSAGRFCLLTGVLLDSATLADPDAPEEARSHLTRRELARVWSGRLLVLRGVPGGR
jgi:ABC-type bacteriocin/lantibiotic exporter with double-glycine peptidase domain